MVVIVILNVGIQYLLHAAFVADKFWSDELEPARTWFEYAAGVQQSRTGTWGTSDGRVSSIIYVFLVYKTNTCDPESETRLRMRPKNEK